MFSFKLTVSSILLIWLCGCNAEINGVDVLIFKSFCERPLTKTAFEICFTPAQDKSENSFETDLYSVSPQGKVGIADSGDATKIRYKTFTVIAGEDDKSLVKITCTSTATSGVTADSLVVFPASSTEAQLKLIDGKQSSNNPLGYEISGTFKKGATIVYQSYVQAKCNWSPSAA